MPKQGPPDPGGWRHVPAALVSLLFLFPMWLLVVGSLRPAGQAPPRGAQFVPLEPTVEPFARAFELVPLGRFLLNSLAVGAIAVPLTVVVASWAGLSISRLGPRARGLLIGISLVALMVPVTALIVPRFAIFRMLGLTDTWVPLVAPALIGISPFYVLVFVWAYRRLPPDLFDAARVEGLSWLQVWRRVALPLTRPVTVAVAVLAFVFTWGDFLGPLIYLFDESLFTVPMGLRSLATLGPQDAPIFLAGSVVASAPVVIAFLAVQRFFLQEHREAGWLAR